MYEIEQLIALAKRENNLKRAYLYVNLLQGKHVPSDPRKTVEMCKVLADKLVDLYSDEKIFIIGFAETATAIASYVASYLEGVLYFENTTREKEIDNNEYLYFTESHSHATEQKINVEMFNNYLSEIQRIIFVEDEVTTGNTIYKLINKIKERYPEKVIKYTIVSIINSMSDDVIQKLDKEGIDCIFLKKIPFEYKKELIDTYKENDICIYDCSNDLYVKSVKINQVIESVNTRLVCKIKEYVTQTINFCEQIYNSEFSNELMKEVLIVGTEEFMYPAIELARYLQEKGVCEEIKVHSTTRSPIMAYNNEGYPLRNRYKLVSVYDDERTVYIYNLKKYDKVVIVTDSNLTLNKGLNSLLSALEKVGNYDISVYQWNIGFNNLS